MDELASHTYICSSNGVDIHMVTGQPYQSQRVSLLSVLNLRRYLLYFSATVFSILLLTACLGLIFEPFEPLTGDLTRFGIYAEIDFGWHAPQPVIQIAANGRAITNPDILVLGDSFSKD